MTAGVPPPVVAQPVADQLPPAARFQYLLAPASNVIPLLPLQSPKRVPDTGAAAPAMVMSRKSMSVREATAAQVSVRVVPIVADRANVRMVALVPAESVKVPLMVWSAENVSNAAPAEVDPATVRLLNVFVPDTEVVGRAELVKLTL